VLAAVVVAGCGDAPEATGSDGPDSNASPTGSPTRTITPTDPGDPGPTELPPSEEPTEAPETEEPSSTAGSGPAAACAGSDDNRDFYAATADAVSWPVYCPVLPAGWFVTAGQYSLADGGQMEISYRGPAGAAITLRQGVVCGGGACAPSGDELGDTAYGDLTGRLWDIGDGGFEVLVDAETSPSWVLTASGLSESDVRAIAADLVVVGG
jgi:hypothetical protein